MKTALTTLQVLDVRKLGYAIHAVPHRALLRSGEILRGLATEKNPQSDAGFVQLLLHFGDQLIQGGSAGRN